MLVLAALAVGALALGLYLGRDQTRDFYVAHADLVDDHYLEKLDKDPDRNRADREDFGFYAHRLQAGHGLVLAHRQFSPGNVLVIDDEIYEKLTVRIPVDRLPTQRQIFDAPAQVLVIFSSGGSAWPRHDCSGQVVGSVELTPSRAGFEVQIQGQFTPLGNSDVAIGDCITRALRFHFHASPMGLKELTPWLGSPGGESPMDATYAD
ncbi:hypothetical protein ACFJGW_06375 [Burkholderiaceae bacterium UC74_6]